MTFLTSDNSISSTSSPYLSSLFFKSRNVAKVDLDVIDWFLSCPITTHTDFGCFFANAGIIQSLTNVDFPHPDSPVIAVIRFLGISICLIFKLRLCRFSN